MAIKIGTNGNDYIWGSDGDDQILGLGGANRLFGCGGDDYGLGGDSYDWLDGGDGNDLLEGAGYADSLVGGSGNDTAAYRTSPTGVYVSLRDGIAQLGDAAGDKLYSIENLWGSQFGDILGGDDA